MSELVVPIILNSNLIENHLITHFLQLDDLSKLVTGSLGGELVIWQTNTLDNIEKPIIYMTPCLDQSVGRVTCLILINNPIQNLTEDIKQCILTVHNDKRVRIWDILDGRCINISPHNIFTGDPDIYMCSTFNQKQSRFYIFAGNSRKLFFFDIWKMKNIGEIEICEKNQQLCCMQIDYQNRMIYLIDSKNIFYIVQYGDFDNENYNDFQKYINNQLKYQKNIKELLNSFRIVGKIEIQSYQIPVNLVISENLNDIIVVYPFMILFYDKNLLIQNSIQQKANMLQIESEIDFVLDQNNNKKNQNQQQQINNSFIKLSNYKNYNYQNIEILNQQQNQPSYFLISTKEGSVLILSKFDYDIIKEITYKYLEMDIGFTLGTLSFQKQQGKCQSSLNINLNELVIINQDDPQQKNNLFIKHQGIQLSSINFQTYKIYSYDINQQSLKCFQFLQYFIENSTKISHIKDFQCLLQDQIIKDMKITFYSKSDNLYLIGNPESMKLYNDENSNQINQILEYKIYQFNDKESQVNLKSFDNMNIYRINFQLNYQIFSKSLIKFTNLILNLLQLKFSLIKSLIYIQLFNLILDQNLSIQCIYNLQIFKFYKFDDHFKEKYQNNIELEFKDKLINIKYPAFINDDIFQFIGTSDGNIYAFPLLFQSNTNTFQIGKINLDQSSIVFIQCQKNYLIVSTQKCQTFILDMKDYKNRIILDNISVDKNNSFQFMNLSSLIIFKQQLSDKIKNIQNIYKFEQLNNDQQYSEQLSSKINIVYKLQAFISQNNAIYIYSYKTNRIEHDIRFNTSGLQVIFYMSSFEYLIILTKDKKLLFYSMESKRFERESLQENFKQFFDFEGYLNQKLKLQENYNDYSDFKTIHKDLINPQFGLIEYSCRYYTDIINYFKESSKKIKQNKLFIEILGNQKQIQQNQSQVLDFILMQENKKWPFLLSKSKVNGMNLMKINLYDNDNTDDSYFKINYILYIDCSIHNLNIIESFIKNNNSDSHKLFNYFTFLYPWGRDISSDSKVNFKQLKQKLQQIINYQRSVFKYTIGIQGVGCSFSFPILSNNQFEYSQFQSTNLTLSLIVHLATLAKFQNNIVSQILDEIIQNLTLNVHKQRQNFVYCSLPILYRFCLNQNQIIQETATKILIYTLQNNNELQFNYKFMLDILFNQNSSEKIKQQNYISQIELIFILELCYKHIYGSTQINMIEQIFQQKIIDNIDIYNCLKNPNLIIQLINIIIEGIHIWKSIIQNINSLIKNLMIIYFHYNITNEQLEIFQENPTLNNKKIDQLLQFQQQNQQIRKNMRNILINAIIQLGNIDINEFTNLLKNEISSQERHLLYLLSLIDLIKNFLKIWSHQNSKMLPIFIEYILKCIDPTQLTYRKQCHKQAIKAIYSISKTYYNLSFHSNTQKLAIGTFESQIIVYDIRISQKWRVLEKHDGPVSCLCFDSEGTLIASYSYTDNSIRIWKVGSNGFFGGIIELGGKYIKKIEVPKKNIIEENIKINFSQNDKSVLLHCQELGTLKFNL